MACVRCGCGVFQPEDKIVLNKTWHKCCFNCLKCNQPLCKTTATVWLGEVFCSSCRPQDSCATDCGDEIRFCKICSSRSSSVPCCKNNNSNFGCKTLELSSCSNQQTRSCRSCCNLPSQKILPWPIPREMANFYNRNHTRPNLFDNCCTRYDKPCGCNELKDCCPGKCKKVPKTPLVIKKPCGDPCCPEPSCPPQKCCPNTSSCPPPKCYPNTSQCPPSECCPSYGCCPVPSCPPRNCYSPPCTPPRCGSPPRCQTRGCGSPPRCRRSSPRGCGSPPRENCCPSKYTCPPRACESSPRCGSSNEGCCPSKPRPCCPPRNCESPPKCCPPPRCCPTKPSCPPKICFKSRSCRPRSCCPSNDCSRPRRRTTPKCRRCPLNNCAQGSCRPQCPPPDCQKKNCDERKCCCIANEYSICHKYCKPPKNVVNYDVPVRQCCGKGFSYDKCGEPCYPDTIGCAECCEIKCEPCGLMTPDEVRRKLECMARKNAECQPKNCKKDIKVCCPNQGGCSCEQKNTCTCVGCCSCRPCVNLTPRCIRCKQKVYAAEKILVSAGAFHNNCFNCHCCNKVLDVINVFEGCGEIYCKQCYSNFFGVRYYGYE